MINLLPPQQKKELLQERKCRLALILLISAVVFLIALSLLLFSVKIYILGKAQSEEIIISQELQDSEKEILAINKKLQSLDSFYGKQPDFTGFLEKISRMFPSGVYLTSLSLNFAGKEANYPAHLQGFSPTRELLLQLKKNLESEPGFKDINFPLSNLVRPDSIDFNISFQVEP